MNQAAPDFANTEQALLRAAHRLRDLFAGNPLIRQGQTAQRARDRVLRHLVERGVGIAEVRVFPLPDARRRRVLACVTLSDGAEIQEGFDLAAPLPAPPDGEDFDYDESALAREFLGEEPV